MLAAVSSFGLSGIDAYPVTVEADLSRGLPAFEIVGLPDAAVKAVSYTHLDVYKRQPSRGSAAALRSVSPTTAEGVKAPL